MNALINIGMIVTYIFAGLALASILFFIIKSLIVNYKEMVFSLVGVLALGLLFLISFLISKSGDVGIEIFEKTGTNPSLSKLIGSGPIMLYFMIAAVFVAIIYAQVVKLFKK